MTKKLGLLAALLAIVAAPSIGFSGSDTEIVDLDAVFVQGISLTQTSSLNFGTTVLDGVAGGTLVIDPDGAPLLVWTGTSVITNIGATRASFDVLTSPNVDYTVNIPNAPMFVPCNIGPCFNPTVTVGSFNFYSAATNIYGVDAGVGHSSLTGTDTLHVGATLTFLATEEGDFYDTFLVTATYP